MKAIDRAARWAALLEEAGYEIESQTDVGHNYEYLTVHAVKDISRIWFVIRMDTKHTQFVAGCIDIWGLGKVVKRPSLMAQQIFSEIGFQRYREQQQAAS